MLTSKESNKALEDLNDKLSEIMNKRGKIKSYWLSALSEITNPETTSPFKLVTDPQGNPVNDLLIKKTKQVTFYDNLLIILDTDKKVELQGDILKMTINKNYDVDLAKLIDKKLMFDLEKKCSSLKEL